MEDSGSSSWYARRENSISMKEWDIPYEQLLLGEKIGSGRFSTGKKVRSDSKEKCIKEKGNFI